MSKMRRLLRAMAVLMVCSMSPTASAAIRWPPELDPMLRIGAETIVRRRYVRMLDSRVAPDSVRGFERMRFAHDRAIEALRREVVARRVARESLGPDTSAGALWIELQRDGVFPRPATMFPVTERSKRWLADRFPVTKAQVLEERRRSSGVVDVRTLSLGDERRIQELSFSTDEVARWIEEHPAIVSQRPELTAGLWTWALPVIDGSERHARLAEGLRAADGLRDSLTRGLFVPGDPREERVQWHMPLQGEPGTTRFSSPGMLDTLEAGLREDTLAVLGPFVTPTSVVLVRGLGLVSLTLDHRGSEYIARTEMASRQPRPAGNSRTLPARQQLLDWFVAHRSQYPQREAYAVRRVRFSITPWDSLPESRVRQHYVAHQGDFSADRTTWFAEIVIPRQGEGALDLELMRATADSIGRALAAGTDFDVVGRSAQSAGIALYTPELKVWAGARDYHTPVLDGLALGQVGVAFETPNGLHLVRCLDRIETGTPPFERIRREVALALWQHLGDSLRPDASDVLAALRRHAPEARRALRRHEVRLDTLCIQVPCLDALDSWSDPYRDARQLRIAADGEWLPSVFGYVSGVELVQRIRALPPRPLTFDEALPLVTADYARALEAHEREAFYARHGTRIDSLLDGGVAFEDIPRHAPVQLDSTFLRGDDPDLREPLSQIGWSELTRMPTGRIWRRLEVDRGYRWLWVRALYYPASPAELSREPDAPEIRAAQLREFDAWFEEQMHRTPVVIVDRGVRAAFGERPRSAQPSLSPTSSSRTVPPRSRAAR